MHRIKNVRENIISINNGIRAVIEGTKNKRGKREVQILLYNDTEVKGHPELWHTVDPDKAKDYITPICEELATGRYQHGKPKHRLQFCQTSKGGKWRDLYIPKLKDHIVHHMLMQGCMKAFTRGMHPHCCGSVPERGIKHIAHWVDHWMKNDKECRYFVKLDICKFLSFD